jgi:hypothetical protein
MPGKSGSRTSVLAAFGLGFHLDEIRVYQDMAAPAGITDHSGILR